VFKGSGTIEKVLATWSLVLYGIYLAMCIWAFSRFGGDIVAQFSGSEPEAGWFLGGVKYAAYSLAIIPAVLFATRHIETRREAVAAGVLAGPIAMLPALLFYVAIVSQYPAVLDRPVPVNHLLEELGSRPFQLVFQVVLFGTLIETGAGMIHALNERVASVFLEFGKAMPGVLRAGTAVVLLLLGAALSQLGLIALIARGYGTLTWLFLAIFVVPILTLGVWKIYGHGRAATEEPLVDAGP
jgi:uncharacterized membrane protein YkvI